MARAGKIASIFLLILLFSAILSPISAQNTPKTITLRVWGIPEFDSFRGITAGVREFERRYPHIRVELGAPGGTSDVSPQKLLTAVAAGTPPDLILQDRFTISGWAARGAFRPLNDLVEVDSINPDSFYEAAWNEAVYRGKLYGLPSDIDARGLYYNRATLRKYGYDRPPENWDELVDYAVKMTVKKGRNYYEQVGFAPLWGNTWLYLFGWQNGGQFLSQDGLRCTMNQPRIVEALSWMKKAYDAIGGYENIRGFQSQGGFGGTVDPFIIGKVVLLVNGSWVLDDIARYKPELDFGVAYPPPPEGREPITWSGGFAWAIPAASRHTSEAWELAKWLSFEEGRIFCGKKQKEFNKSIGKNFFIPRFSCQPGLNRRLFEVFPAPNENLQTAVDTYLDMLNHTRFRPVTPVGRTLWDENARAMEAALMGVYTPKEALDIGAKRVQEELNRIYIPPDYPLLNWNYVILAGLIIFLIALGIWLRAFVKFWKNTRIHRKEALAGILFASPWMVGFLVFMLGPILVSLVFSFCQYDVLHPARFAGVDNYKHLFGFHEVPNIEGGTDRAPSDPYFWKSLWNTMYITLIGVPLSLVIGLAIALLLNTEIRGISFYRTFFYIPSIVPIAATAVLWGWLLHSQIGGVNILLRPLCEKLNVSTPMWFDSPTWSKPALLLMLMWGAGASMIIWLAGLKGIPKQLYEAARIDGAGAIGRFFNVTLPMLSPYIFFNMVIGVISYLQIFTQAYIVSTPPNAGPSDSLLVFVYYLFNNAFTYFKMGYASALAWILFIIILILTLIQLRFAKHWVHYEGGGGA